MDTEFCVDYIEPPQVDFIIVTIYNCNNNIAMLLIILYGIYSIKNYYFIIINEIISINETTAENPYYSLRLTEGVTSRSVTTTDHNGCQVGECDHYSSQRESGGRV